MLQTMFPLSRTVTNSYRPPQIRAGHMTAVRLLKIRVLDQLKYNPQDKKGVVDAKRIILMGIAARAKFNHLYPGGRLDSSAQGQEISERAYERYQECAKLLEEYPKKEKNAFRTKTDFIYNWLIGVAKNRPKYYLKMFNPQGATLPKIELQRLLTPHIKELSDLNEDNSPTLYYVTMYVILRTSNRLPFDIQIPF